MLLPNRRAKSEISKNRTSRQKIENILAEQLLSICLILQTVGRSSGKMRFNKSEVAALALGQPSHKFEKEGVLFVKERQEGFFRRAESEYKVRMLHVEDFLFVYAFVYLLLFCMF